MSLSASAAKVIETAESTVRTYSRSFPAVFSRASGDHMFTEDGESYLDFLAGAGSLNYGHNPAAIKEVLLGYLERDGLAQGLDMYTSAKGEFLDHFGRYVLAPRELGYKVQFCSPSGTNAVEAALKVARLVTGRSQVIAFAGAFHGVSTGSLAATSGAYYRQGLYATLPATTHLPYPDSPLGNFDSLDLLRRLTADPSSGLELPAAVLVETVQSEGGVYVAPVEFLQGLRDFCDQHGILMIVDDVQAGCGRTGPFFSFERAGIVPDIVPLSKSISGYGLPMALLLIKPEYDIWRPGQHNGTFRGNQLAFVAGAAALREYWADGIDGELVQQVRRKSALTGEFLHRTVARSSGATVRGVGLMWGVDFGTTGLSAGKISKLCFDRGLIAETCGRDGEVLKVLPPLTISEENLRRGLEIIASAVSNTMPDFGESSSGWPG